ncbi:hypothetical protein D910_06069 [Dendroctonus ponderosae]|uniref:E3 ubiquitin-protein ligase parkin n=1 Tax=Dendroctonus ponderosae TaxID=77166 RepID=U4UFJ0_DENPD|nr:hypothetical protein D910_06069 [Dendroctonus ponderosae]
MLRFLTSFFGNLFQIMLHLLTWKKNIIQNLLSIYVKTIGGSTLCIDVDPKCKVSYIKKLVAPQLGLEPNEMKVIFAGKELGDDIVIDDSMFSTGSESRTNSISVDASDMDNSSADIKETEISEDHRQRPKKVHFFVYCPTCKDMKNGENDQAVPLDLIRPNLKQVPCLACLEAPEIMFTFPCQNDHIACLYCFKQYCMSKLTERQFWQHPEYGYTLICPNGCADSFIKEIHHFRLLDDVNYERYHRFATEEFVLQAGGILCPQPGCGMGILADPDCIRITCQSCKYVFCRNCRQGFHIGECDTVETPENGLLNGNCNNELSCDNESKGDDASRTTIKVITKPCPSCKTPTERDGGCMHMICTRSGCKFHWCWVCQMEWTRECMADHWF